MKKVWWMGEENIVMREAPSFAHTIYVHYHNLQKQLTNPIFNLRKQQNNIGKNTFEKPCKII